MNIIRLCMGVFFFFHFNYQIEWNWKGLDVKSEGTHKCKLIFLMMINIITRRNYAFWRLNLLHENNYTKKTWQLHIYFTEINRFKLEERKSYQRQWKRHWNLQMRGFDFYFPLQILRKYTLLIIDDCFKCITQFNNKSNY